MSIAADRDRQIERVRGGERQGVRLQPCIVSFGIDSTRRHAADRQIDGLLYRPTNQTDWRDKQGSRQGRQAGRQGRQADWQVSCITSSPQTTPLLLPDITSLISRSARWNILRRNVSKRLPFQPSGNSFNCLERSRALLSLCRISYLLLSFAFAASFSFYLSSSSHSLPYRLFEETQFLCTYVGMYIQIGEWIQASITFAAVFHSLRRDIFGRRRVKGKLYSTWTPCTSRSFFD